MMNQPAIPDLAEFTAELSEIFDLVSKNEGGEVARYIPQLSSQDPDKFGVSVCTVDGRQFSLGDSKDHFCVQSVCKPLNYCLALEEHGEETTHQFVGHEPSGHGFNELKLNSDGMPHNPMINAGAIVCCSLIRPDLTTAQRFDYVLDNWKRLCGGTKPGFNNGVYLSERETGDRNYALAYFMREQGTLPRGVDLIQTLEFYFQCCAIEVNCDALAVSAAALSNAGVCPLTGEAVIGPNSVKNCLSLMSSCGMYDFSGEFAFKIGLPAKSGVSGGMMVVIPKIMGLALWSPRLDRLGNSVRGVQFCQELARRYDVHVYDCLTDRRGNIDLGLRRKLVSNS